MKTTKSGSKAPAPGKSSEVVALLRMTQIIASGEEVDIVNCIGKHECNKYPPALFNDDGAMRATGIKSSLIKLIKSETKT